MFRALCYKAPYISVFWGPPFSAYQLTPSPTSLSKFCNSNKWNLPGKKVGVAVCTLPRLAFVNVVGCCNKQNNSIGK